MEARRKGNRPSTAADGNTLLITVKLWLLMKLLICTMSIRETRETNGNGGPKPKKAKGA
jgi:hypothetical protein